MATEQFSIAPNPFPIKSAVQLLADQKIKRLLFRLEKLANAPQEHYKILYLDTINAYAEFVQELPASHVTGFGHTRGLLNLGIERAIQALVHYRREYPLNGIKPEDMPKEWALYSYALFTAGLFYGLGQVMATYIVSLCDRRGKMSEIWIPTTGPMTLAPQTHYRYAFDSANRDALAARATTVLAQRIMPNIAFDWLASDINIFDYWLAILQNDERHGGLIAKIVLYAQRELLTNIALQTQAEISTHHISDEFIETPQEAKEQETAKETEEPHNKVVEEREAVGHRLEIPGISPGAEITAASIIGAQGGEFMQQLFLNWLRIAVFKNPYFSVNHANSNVVVNNQGVFIRGQELIQQFMRDNRINASISEVVKSLQKNNTLSVIRQSSKQGSSTYFVVNDVTKMLHTETLPVIDKKAMNVPQTNQGSAWPTISNQQQNLNTLMLQPKPKS